VVDADAVAAEILAALDAAGQIERLSTRMPGFAAADAYRVTASLRALRTARGERQVGRKIGFTNRNMWPEYGVYEPFWGDMYDTTVNDVLPGASVRVSHLPEPRIEPEIVLGIEGGVKPGMSAEAVLGPSAGSRMASRSCSRSIPGGVSLWLIASPTTGFTGRLRSAQGVSFMTTSAATCSGRFRRSRLCFPAMVSQLPAASVPTCSMARSRLWFICWVCLEMMRSIRVFAVVKSSPRGP